MFGHAILRASTRRIGALGIVSKGCFLWCRSLEIMFFRFSATTVRYQWIVSRGAKVMRNRQPAQFAYPLRPRDVQHLPEEDGL